MKHSTIFRITELAHCCGYYAAMRWLENQTGCNRATAIRCIQAAKLCEAMNKIS